MELSTEGSYLYFIFDLPLSSLFYLKTKHDLNHLRRLYYKRISIVGIDTETQPRFSVHMPTFPTALIQLALRMVSGEEFVMLVDLIELKKNETDFADLFSIFSLILKDKSIIKLGQGLAQDLLQLRSAYESKAFDVCANILEPNAILHILHPENYRMRSLRDLTRQYLHFELDKKCQLSNWGKRPLTIRQQYYAANDALVLLRLFDAMTFEAASIIADFRVDDHFVQFNAEEHIAIAEERSKNNKRKKRHAKRNGTAHCPPPGGVTSSIIASAATRTSTLSAAEYEPSTRFIFHNRLESQYSERIQAANSDVGIGAATETTSSLAHSSSQSTSPHRAFTSTIHHHAHTPRNLNMQSHDAYRAPSNLTLFPDQYYSPPRPPSDQTVDLHPNQWCLSPGQLYLSNGQCPIPPDQSSRPPNLDTPARNHAFPSSRASSVEASGSEVKTYCSPGRDGSRPNPPSKQRNNNASGSSSSLHHSVEGISGAAGSPSWWSPVHKKWKGGGK